MLNAFLSYQARHAVINWPISSPGPLISVSRLQEEHKEKGEQNDTQEQEYD